MTSKMFRKTNRTFLSLFGFLLSLAVFGCSTPAEPTPARKGSLKQRLNQMSEASGKKISPERKAVMEKAASDLKKKKIEQRALKVGDSVPQFSLQNSRGESVSLSALLKKSPVVLTFYRGGWCPYCNEQLQAYQESLDQIQDAGGQLVAVTPDSPSSAQDTVSAKKIDFDVLSDTENKLARKCGLAFQVGDELKKLYLEFGIDLEKSQGNKEWELPVPATYVVNQNGKITYAFVDIDYKKRAEPRDIVAALKKIREEKP